MNFIHILVFLCLPNDAKTNLNMYWSLMFVCTLIFKTFNMPSRSPYHLCWHLRCYALTGRLLPQHTLICTFHFNISFMQIDNQFKKLITFLVKRNLINSILRIDFISLNPERPVTVAFVFPKNQIDLNSQTNNGTPNSLQWGLVMKSTVIRSWRVTYVDPYITGCSWNSSRCSIICRLVEEPTALTNY